MTNHQEAEELLPCPFCGGSPVQNAYWDYWCHNPLCDIHHIAFRTKERWNTRHQPPQQPAFSTPPKPMVVEAPDLSGALMMAKEDRDEWVAKCVQLQNELDYINRATGLIELLELSRKNYADNHAPIPPSSEAVMGEDEAVEVMALASNKAEGISEDAIYTVGATRRLMTHAYRALLAAGVIKGGGK